MRKKLSIMIPCYNEEENVREICAAVIDTLEKELSDYDYEILFIDNCSTDKTRVYLRQMCADNPKVKAILNAKNFGQFNSPYYGMCQTTGDCTITLCCDFQDPVELIPQFVKEWENGYMIVSGIKTASKENKLMRFMRTCYYKVIRKMSDVEQIEHFTGFGLYDKSFIQVLRDLKDPTPFIRGIVAELGYKRKDISYTQPKRKAGKTHNNWATLYDAAMLSFTSYTKGGLRLATILGFVFSVLGIIISLVYLILKLVFWDRFVAGMIPILLVVCVFGSAQLFFIGLIGEYILSMNKRIMNRPLVIEEERLNFGKEEENEGC
ncbi:MAG: glycosyltransferase family 2 protein [Lachnospiraceae bacterium]|nr:glycosyltransferase family 2 protein [Lachnospiraceae bacterium]